MMSVLLIADLHGQVDKIDSFLGLEPDLVIISGDITHFGPIDSALDVLSRIEVPCFVVPGNCDPREILDIFEESNAVSLHGSAMTVGRLSIAGIGGSNPTPFNCPFELSEEEIDTILSSAIKAMDRAMYHVLVSHAPPKGALDVVGDVHVGSESIRKHMKKFDLVCCAHIHEQRGVTELDGVKIVNPGEASKGECALLRFNDEEKEIQIELKDL
ncbi:MAG: metallophosphoesterase [Methanomicrobiales archaeon]|nr:metallophosphoesterase [Methanomicrobiales archaeon]